MKVGDLVKKKVQAGLVTEGLVGIVLQVNTWQRVDGTIGPLLFESGGQVIMAYFGLPQIA